VEIPDAGQYLWDWFWDIDRDRIDNNPLDIKAWAELTGTVIRPDEVEILRQMDHAYRPAMSAEIADAQKRMAAEQNQKR